MPTVAIVNEKGGTGKTTTAVSLSAALGEMGAKVLLVDLDGQAAASRWLGVEGDSRLADALLAGEGLEPLVEVIPGVSLAPGCGKLDSVAHDLRPTQGGQLRKVLATVAKEYDYTLIDCPPSLGNRLIGNALLAASHAIIPVEASILALDGVGMVLTTLQDIRDGFSHDIKLIAALACRYDGRTRLSRLILQELTRALGGKVFKTIIRETVRMQECPASGKSILEYAPDCSAAADYRALAHELVSGNWITGSSQDWKEQVAYDEAAMPNELRRKAGEIFQAAKPRVIKADEAELDKLAEETQRPAQEEVQPVEEAQPPAPREVLPVEEVQPAKEEMLSVEEGFPRWADPAETGAQEEQRPPATAASFVDLSPDLPEPAGEDPDGSRTPEDSLTLPEVEMAGPPDEGPPDVPGLGLDDAFADELPDDQAVMPVARPVAETHPESPESVVEEALGWADLTGPMAGTQDDPQSQQTKSKLTTTMLATLLVLACVALVGWRIVGGTKAGPQPAAAEDNLAITETVTTSAEDELAPAGPALPEPPAANEASNVPAEVSEVAQAGPDTAVEQQPVVRSDPSPPVEPVQLATDASQPPVDRDRGSGPQEENPAEGAAPAQDDVITYIPSPPGYSLTCVVKAPTGYVAMINGRARWLGQTVNGAKIVDISMKTVEMDLNGKRFVLGIGEHTSYPAKEDDEATE